MGGYRQGPENGDAVLQSLGPFDGVWGHPAAYGGQGGWVYVLESAGGGFLRALSYGVNGEGLPQLTSAATSPESFGYTSGSPLVTSNGTTAGTAIVWVVYASGPSGGAGQLRAYNAAPSGGSMQLLWSGKLGKASKFSTPTAYEGRVYVGTRNGTLVAFGSSAAAPVQASAVEVGEVPLGESRTVTLPVEVTRDLTLTGPITTSGVEYAPAPAPPGAPKTSPGRPARQRRAVENPAVRHRRPRTGGADRQPAGAGRGLPGRCDGAASCHVPSRSPRPRGREPRHPHQLRYAIGRRLRLRLGAGPAALRRAARLRDGQDRRGRQAAQLHILQFVERARAHHGRALSVTAIRDRGPAADRHRPGTAPGIHGLGVVRPRDSGQLCGSREDHDRPRLRDDPRYTPRP